MAAAIVDVDVVVVVAIVAPIKINSSYVSLARVCSAVAVAAALCCGPWPTTVTTTSTPTSTTTTMNIPLRLCCKTSFKLRPTFRPGKGGGVGGVSVGGGVGVLHCQKCLFAAHSSPLELENKPDGGTLERLESKQINKQTTFHSQFL